MPSFEILDGRLKLTSLSRQIQGRGDHERGGGHRPQPHPQRRGEAGRNPRRRQPQRQAGDAAQHGGLPRQVGEINSVSISEQSWALSVFFNFLKSKK